MSRSAHFAQSRAPSTAPRRRRGGAPRPGPRDTSRRGRPPSSARKTLEIYDTIFEIAERRAKAGTPTYLIADMMVEERLAAASRSKMRAASPSKPD